MYYISNDPTQTEQSFVAAMIAEVGLDNVVAGSADSAALYSLPVIHEVKGLKHMGFGHFETTEHSYIRHDAPSGARFYSKQVN